VEEGRSMNLAVTDFTCRNVVNVKNSKSLLHLYRAQKFLTERFEIPKNNMNDLNYPWTNI